MMYRGKKMSDSPSKHATHPLQNRKLEAGRNCNSGFAFMISNILMKNNIMKEKIYHG